MKFLSMAKIEFEKKTSIPWNNAPSPFGAIFREKIFLGTKIIFEGELKKNWTNLDFFLIFNIMVPYFHSN